MALETDQDRTGLLSDFGIEYRVNNRTYTGIFDNEYIEEFGVSGAVPVLLCRTIDVATVSRGDYLYIDEKKYTVQEKQPDNLGLSVLILRLE